MAYSVRRAEHVAALTAVALLAATSFAILRPFVAAILWAFVIALATWPLFEQVLRWFEGRRTLAAGAMITALTVLLFVPLLLFVLALSRGLPDVLDWAREVIAHPPPPPDWVLSSTILRDSIGSLWLEAVDPNYDLQGVVESYRGKVYATVWGFARGLGEGLLQTAVSLLIVFFLYRDGEVVAREVHALTERIAGSRAERLLKEAHGTVTGVLYGIIGVAIVQGGLTAFGLWLMSVPFPLLLGVVAALVSSIPLGPGLVIWPAAAWLFFEERYAAAVFIFVWGLVPVGLADYLIRTLFVSRSSRLPFVLILLGLIGGALFAGVIGLFLGPVVLAVGFALVREWASEQRLRVRAAREERAAATGD
ncbi:MAG: AI-2E family transporter [Pseudomonadota bacterium]